MVGRNTTRYIMYVNQLEHMNYSFDELYEKLINAYPEDSSVQFAMIEHDKDKDDYGNLAKPHVHVSLYNRNGFSLKKLKEVFDDDKDEHFDFMRNKDASFLYLTHRTNKAMKDGKYLYPVDSVKANFDYEGYLASKIDRQYSDVQDIVNRIMSGDLEEKDLLDNDDLALVYANNTRRIENALRIREKVIKHAKEKEEQRNLR